jgi:hypothetical protein
MGEAVLGDASLVGKPRMEEGRSFGRGWLGECRQDGSRILPVAFVCRIHYGCLPPTALLLDDDDPDELPYQALVLPHSLEPH